MNILNSGNKNQRRFSNLYSFINFLFKAMPNYMFLDDALSS